MSAKKRERSVNFGIEEVELLITLVAQHKHILENKKSDAVTWQQKEQCWNKLEQLFNSTSVVNFRSAKTLKSKYEGIKRVIRKKSAAIQAETYCKEGSTVIVNAPPLTPFEKKVKDMILLSIDGVESQFDFDNVDSTRSSLSRESFGRADSPKNEAILNTQIKIEFEGILSDEADMNFMEPLEQPIIENQPKLRDDSDGAPPPKRKQSEYQPTPEKFGFDNANDDKKWTNWKPKSLRFKRHPALSASKMKRPFERVGESKLEIAELQKTILEEELLNKRKQWAFEEEEREHKKQVWDLEKKYWLNK